MTSQTSLQGLCGQHKATPPSRKPRVRQRSVFAHPEEGTVRYGCFLGKRSNRSLHHSSNFSSNEIWLPGSESNRGPQHARFSFLRVLGWSYAHDELQRLASYH